MGEVTKEVRKAVEAAPANVIATGHLPRKDVLERFLESDLLVFPSHREGSPMTVLEAMAAGLPVVATRVGGLPELIDDGRGGYLVSPAAVDELTEPSAASSPTESALVEWAGTTAGSASKSSRLRGVREPVHDLRRDRLGEGRRRDSKGRLPSGDGSLETAFARRRGAAMRMPFAGRAPRTEDRGALSRLLGTRQFNSLHCVDALYDLQQYLRFSRVPSSHEGAAEVEALLFVSSTRSRRHSLCRASASASARAISGSLLDLLDRFGALGWRLRGHSRARGSVRFARYQERVGQPWRRNPNSRRASMAGPHAIRGDRPK